MSLKVKAEGTTKPTVPSPKRIWRGTEQQEAFWKMLSHGDTHVVAEARAGCGKSSSCREGMWRMLERYSTQKIRYSVFNKANALEFKKDCPATVEVSTSHSFGFLELKRCFESDVDKDKTYVLLDGLPGGATLPRYLRKSISKLVSYAKNHAFDPANDDLAMSRSLGHLMSYYSINDWGRRDKILEWATTILRASVKQTQIIDFDDMIWLPGLLKLDFPKVDVLFLDEVQDFNAAQHIMVKLMCPSGRVVAVGDRHQAINAFRGADMDSIPLLREALTESPRKLNDAALTVTFRCPKSHVALANHYVPDLVAHDSNKDGIIEENIPFDTMLDGVKPGDLVICPTNAPMVKGALTLIKNRRKGYVRGRAVGDSLINILYALRDPQTISQAMRRLDEWKAREISKVAERDGCEDLVEQIEDRAEGLEAILHACESPAEAQPLISQLFDEVDRDDSVTFSSVHRAKGDEADNVWYVQAPQRQATQDWEIRQQTNLRYVALTRSKDRLALVEPPVS